MRLTNLPYFRTLQEYQIALDRYIRQAAKTQALKAAYQFGSVGAPGLSDIDLALVVDEKITQRELLNLSISNLSVDDQKIFLHEPLIVTEHNKNILFETNYVKNLNRIYGEDGCLKTKSALPDIYTRWAITLEYVPMYLFCLQKWLVQGKVDVRLAIPVLRSIKYLLELNSDFKKWFWANWESYADNVNFLCDNWFRLSDNDSARILESAIQEAWNIVVDIAWARDTELTDDKKFTSEREMRKPNKLVYSLDVNVISTKERPVNWQNAQHNQLFYPSPPSCLLMLDVYHATGGRLARFLDSLSFGCWSDLQPNTAFELYLGQRAHLINEQIEFLYRKKAAFGYSVTNFVYSPSAPRVESIVTRATKKIWMLSLQLFENLRRVKYY